MNDGRIEELLARTGDRTAWPATPSMVPAVRARITTAERPRAAAPVLRYAAAAAAVALVALGVILAMPASRDALAGLFDIEGSRVEPLPSAPASPPPASDIDGRATPVASIDDAASGAGFAPSLPGNQAPFAAYTVDYGSVSGIVLAYEDYTLWQVRGDGTFDGAFEKGVPPPATIQDVSVNGLPARWVSGGPHVVAFVSNDGEWLDGTVRTVGDNTLIWRSGETLYRLETTLRLDDAVAIASALP